MNAVVNLSAESDANEENMIAVELDEIHVLPGFNPRTRINEDSDPFKELADSIKAHGVVQPIIIRPRAEGGYWLIAGERRVRASRVVGRSPIKAVVRDVDESVALEIALIENAAREGVSAIQEAVSAHKLMDKYDGNREEVMARLGWNKAKLDRRLLLVHAVEGVRDAYLDGKIPLGMVELLAGVPAESQVGTMNAAIEKKLSVADLKARLDAATAHFDLSKAVFDIAACNECPHNSTSQMGLFSEHLSEGRCMNRSCYGEKVKAALEGKKITLADEYNAVFLDTEKLRESWVVVSVTGEDGVGLAQFNQCKGCGHFGALMSTAPGAEGKVTGDVCFNKDCHAEKVSARHDAEAKTAAGKRKTGNAATKGGSTGKPTPTTTATKSSPAKAAVTPKRVVETADGFFRSLSMQVVSSDTGLKMAIAAYALWKDTSQSFDLTPYIGEGVNKTRPELIEAFYKLEGLTRTKLISDLTLFVMGERKDDYSEKEMVKTAERVVKITETTLPGKFTLSAEFLKAHTKAGIEALLHEAKTAEGQSFPDWYAVKMGNENAFKKLMTEKLDDMLPKILDSGFDFSQFVPSCISSRV